MYADLRPHVVRFSVTLVDWSFYWISTWRYETFNAVKVVRNLCLEFWYSKKMHTNRNDMHVIALQNN